ncbi:hypothetical protein QE152_g24483 [Popillia japonica]|uniref:CCHC-type domain-containing protein n=1 Tax=Popillia japonica TaxID=7064 RepID=A0AAW1KFU4_POPJA
MNELSKVAKPAKIQNTRERKNAVCRDEARFEHKQTVLHEEANNIEEEYSVLQKVHLNIQKNQQLAISALEEQAKRMKMHSDYKFPPIEKGTTVTIPVPDVDDVDRSKGDLRNLIERKPELKCYKCWEYGHIKSVCTGPDREWLRLKCAKEEHKATACPNEPYCVHCNWDVFNPAKEEHKATACPNEPYCVHCNWDVFNPDTKSAPS